MKKLIILLVLLLCLSACSEQKVQKDTTTITDVRGREVAVPKKISKVYYPYYYENLLTIAGPDAFKKVIASSTYDTENYSKTFYQILHDKSPGFKEMKDIGSTLKDNFDIEQLIALKPDVAIFANYQYDAIGEDNINLLEQSGIPVVFIDYTDLTPEAHTKSTTIIGQLFSSEKRAQELNDNYTAHVKKVKEAVAKIPDHKLKSAYFELRYNGPTFKEYGKTYGRHMLGLLAAEAGAKNIYEDKVKELGDVDPEYLFQQDPEAIFLDGGNYADKNMKTIRTGYTISKQETNQSISQLVKVRPGFEELTAVKNRHVYALDNDLMRTMKDYVLMEYIGKMLYPDYFKDFEPTKELTVFNKKYLPQLPADSSFMTKWED
ncbi:ABC transporter substrate-binding protein [Macrococcus brunensis]|uniref:ABC transporter substrate-binding protein n=1 Tax=Macrococcus brunensis TaxID=198483 RepID=UPI001EEFC939|nr:ABC transporter substrate-binding protein [Macrococcus brunensis]ULG72405.1 ABC transporter substrate-binding protein [Macrococcus brunensis]